MSQRNNGADVVFQFFLWIVVGGMVFTYVCDIWLHWVPIGLALLVSMWTGQSMQKQRSDTRDP